VVILLNEEIILYQMEELAQKLGVTVRFENINMEESTSTGGLCCVRGEYVIIVHSRATVKEKIKVMIEALRHFDLGDIYIKPVIRQLVEGNEE
jgi:hypothetical protein